MATILKVKSGGTWVDVPAIVGPQGATGPTGSIGSQGPQGDSYTVTQSSGTVISFTEEKVYGTIASPETGNITNSLTGALLGRCVLIIHNSSSAPTFPASWKKTGGNYVTSTNNFIYAMYIDNNNIHYHIKQVI